MSRRTTPRGVILSPEREAALERVIAENDENERQGRVIPLEEVLADLGRAPATKGKPRPSRPPAPASTSARPPHRQAARRPSAGPATA